MLLLYGPFHGADYEAPGWYLHRFLASLGCDRAQGFAYARPDRAEALGAYLAAHA